MKDVDDKFYARADAHISLSNQQVSEEVSAGQVSASAMYSVARFNAWLSARNWNNQQEMAAAKEEAINYFVKEYRMMLEENMDDYIANFNRYMQVNEQK